MQTLKRLLGKLQDLGKLIVSCCCGMVCGVLTVNAVNTVVGLALSALGAATMCPACAAVVTTVLGVCYLVLYIAVALTVCDRVEKFISGCRAQYAYAS